MVWLLSHIYISLALAAIFGLLFGWAFRGLFLRGKARDAMVARDIALTELEQSRREIDALYAAQSKGVGAASQAGDETLRMELEAREQKLQVMTQELAASRGELEMLKEKALVGAGAVTAGVVAAGAAGIAAICNQGTENATEERLDAWLNVTDATLEWRNRYLASRVRALQAQASTDYARKDADSQTDRAERDAATQRAMEAEEAFESFRVQAEEDKQKAIASALAASAASALAATAMAQDQAGAQETPTEEVLSENLGLVKQRWQNAYLRRRLASLPITVPDPAISELGGVGVAPLPDHEAEFDFETELCQPALSVRTEKKDWQNQYLRQRLAYLETHPPKTRTGETEPLGASIEPVVLDSTEPETHPLKAVEMGALEQELARVRWRNRYLERRLAYIDGDAPAPETERVAPVAEPEAVNPNDAEPIAEYEADIQSVPQPDTAPTPAEAVLASIDDDASSMPSLFEQPRGTADDLTKIRGLNENLQEKLNALGVWHYYQIAGWTKEEAEWIEAHLDTDSLIKTENWILHAGALSLGTDIE